MTITHPPLSLGNTADIAIMRDDATAPFQWGRPDRFGTAAYWVEQTRGGTYRDWLAAPPTLAEGLVFCVLGGHGITAEVAAAYFTVMKAHGVTNDGDASEDTLERLLRDPVIVNGRTVRYRFPKQRSTRIAAAVQLVRTANPPTEPVELREWLMQLNGVGYKTASWVVRDVTRSGDVAVVDIHLIDACRAAGVFDGQWDVRRDYLRMEQAFLELARLGNVDPCELDVCIWDQTRTFKRNGGTFDAS